MRINIILSLNSRKLGIFQGKKKQCLLIFSHLIPRTGDLKIVYVFKTFSVTQFGKIFIGTNLIVLCPNCIFHDFSSYCSRLNCDCPAFAFLQQLYSLLFSFSHNVYTSYFLSGFHPVFFFFSTPSLLITSNGTVIVFIRQENVRNVIFVEKKRNKN